MEGRTRRNVLKAGGLIAGGAVVVGGASALADERNASRAGVESAGTTEESAESAGHSGRTTSETPRAELTTEHIESRTRSESPGVTEVGVERPTDGERPDTERPESGKSQPLLGDAAGKSGSGPANSGREDPMDFDLVEWELLEGNRSHGSDDHGNKTGWTVEWRRDPHDASKQGIEVELRMIHGGYANDEARITIDFDPERTAVQRHLPGNAETPGIRIDDKTDFADETVVQRYEIKDEFEDDTVRLRAAATTTTHPKSGATFATIDLESSYTDRFLGTFATDGSKIAERYRYDWP